MSELMLSFLSVDIGYGMDNQFCFSVVADRDPAILQYRERWEMVEGGVD